jgi:hypothetical protein
MPFAAKGRGERHMKADNLCDFCLQKKIQKISKISKFLASSTSHRNCTPKCWKRHFLVKFQYFSVLRGYHDTDSTIGEIFLENFR